MLLFINLHDIDSFDTHHTEQPKFYNRELINLGHPNTVWCACTQDMSHGRNRSSYRKSVCLVQSTYNVPIDTASTCFVGISCSLS